MHCLILCVCRRAPLSSWVWWMRSCRRGSARWRRPSALRWTLPVGRPKFFSFPEWALCPCPLSEAGLEGRGVGGPKGRGAGPGWRNAAWKQSSHNSRNNSALIAAAQPPSWPPSLPPAQLLPCPPALPCPALPCPQTAAGRASTACGAPTSWGALRRRRWSLAWPAPRPRSRWAAGYGLLFFWWLCQAQRWDEGGRSSVWHGTRPGLGAGGRGGLLYARALLLCHKKPLRGRLDG